MLIINHLIKQSAFVLMIWSILEARAEILTKKVHFLGVLKKPKFPSEINWPSYLKDVKCVPRDKNRKLGTYLVHIIIYTGFSWPQRLYSGP